MKKVLFLGVTGRMGPSLIEEYLKDYKKKYKLILGYRRNKPISELESRYADLSSISKLKDALKDIDVVINFAGESNPEENDFKKILEPNIIGLYNLFEAARISGVKRIITASSVHAVRGYPLGSRVLHKDVPMPLNIYGASKVFGEAMCHVYSSKYKMSCIAIRIGAYTPDDKIDPICLERSNYDYMITQRDMAQLIYKCVIASSKVKFGILSGSSDNRRKYLDIEFAKKLVGYRPKDDAFKICEEVKKRNGKKK